MTIITEESLEKTQTEEKKAAFFKKLGTFVEEFEVTANSIPTTQGAILFCGAVEKMARDFKNIFLEVWAKELSAQGVSNSKIKKAQVAVDQDSQQILKAKHTAAS
jgi:hypothetical protein